LLFFNNMHNFVIPPCIFRCPVKKRTSAWQTSTRLLRSSALQIREKGQSAGDLAVWSRRSSGPSRSHRSTRSVFLASHIHVDCVVHYSFWLNLIFSGKDGMNGVNGINGVDGKDGTDGAQGPIGPIGPQGPIGFIQNFKFLLLDFSI
jgi:hypothetical protein